MYSCLSNDDLHVQCYRLMYCVNVYGADDLVSVDLMYGRY